MSTFTGALSTLVSQIATNFGQTVTWTSQNRSVATFTLSAVVDLGDSIEAQARGMFGVLKNVKYSDLAPALNGSSDLMTLQGDQVTFTAPNTLLVTTCRVQKVSDPDLAGTVIVDLRKPSQ